ncbi:MAG: GGDEF domain-containing protein [Cellvibrionaceae bacterium]
MATSLSSHSNRNISSKAGDSSPISTTFGQDFTANTQFKLTTLLQTTIELEPLFELFFGQLQHLLKLSSCQFQNTDRNISIKLGSAATHTCDYSLTIQQQYLGNITFSRKQRFSNDELAQLEALLSTLVYPLRNALNYRDAINQALRDPLTGLGNRGALENALEHQWQMAQRYEQDLGVLMIDIDHFKSINDNYGHDVGDYVIKKIAEVINATTRQTDLTFRYGGEEFLVLLNKTTPIGSTIIAERIRENIEALQLIDNKKQPIQVTVSIGGSHLQPGVDKHTLVKEADKSLYHAKESGRNRVEFHQNKQTSDRKGHLSV